MRFGSPAPASFTVVPEDDGERLDRVLTLRLPDVSRRRAALLIHAGRVRVDGARVDARDMPAVRSSQLVEALLGGAFESLTTTDGRMNDGSARRPRPDLRVVYEDVDVCVVDKPCGLLTAPSPGVERENVAEIVAQRPGGGRIWVVQRLDLPTSGVLVLAKTETANRVLSRKMASHDVGRSYLAVTHGAFGGEATTLDAPLRGRRAVTHAAVVERFGTLGTLLSCTLETGRTHQIRLHCSRAGHAIMGDSRHGQRTAWDPPRMALHAARLAFEHPSTGEPLQFESPLPDDLSSWMAALRTMTREGGYFTKPTSQP